MKLYKTKIGRIFNFIKIEGKFEYGTQVQVMKNTSKYKDYDKYVKQYGIVRNIDYSKKEYMIEVKFDDGKMFGFNPDELRVIGDDEYFNDYNKFKKIFNKIK